MNKIPTTQNQPEQIDLLHTQRVLYLKAKRFFLVRSLLALVFAIGGPFIISSNESLAPYIGIFAIFYLLINSLVLEKIENAKKLLAAKNQELFDVKVLELNWNELVVGARPQPEDIREILHYYKNIDRSKLENWYSPSVKDVGLGFARFLCQRTNSWWDNSLRKRYLSLLYTVLGIVLVSLLVLATTLELSIGKFFLGILMPMVPLIEIIIKQLKEHFDAEKHIKELQTKLDGFIDRIIAGEDIPDADTITRCVQDEIFRHRYKCPMVPDIVYWLYRDKQEDQMNFGIESKVKEYLVKQGKSVAGEK